MKIGLYFGSFNPVHHGHLMIASHVVNRTEIQQVWFVVSPQNPFKTAGSLLNEYDRLHLVNLAIENDETRLRASDVEFKLPRPSYTIDTLIYLEEKYPQHEFSIIMGSDGFINIPRWKNAEVLLKKYAIYVYIRPGYEITDLHGANLTILKAPLLNISATEIRENIKDQKTIRYLVPENVRKEIEDHNYYK
jgi:nicotinate-nucleotide adenylyltransferase